MLCAISAKLQDWTTWMRVCDAYSRGGHNCTRPTAARLHRKANRTRRPIVKSWGLSHEPLARTRSLSSRRARDAIQPGTSAFWTKEVGNATQDIAPLMHTLTLPIHDPSRAVKSNVRHATNCRSAGNQPL